jgi:hypothetical protein
MKADLWDFLVGLHSSRFESQKWRYRVLYRMLACAVNVCLPDKIIKIQLGTEGIIVP